jgi:hypothetical protein
MVCERADSSPDIVGLLVKQEPKSERISIQFGHRINQVAGMLHSLFWREIVPDFGMPP